MPRSIYFRILKHLASNDISLSKLAIANALKLKPSVVIRAINKLRSEGYIHVERHYKGRRVADACRITIKGLLYLVEKNQIAPAECFKFLFIHVNLIESILLKLPSSLFEEVPPEVNSEMQALSRIFAHLLCSPNSFINMVEPPEERERILSGIIKFLKVMREWFVRGIAVIDSVLNQLKLYYVSTE